MPYHYYERPFLQKNSKQGREQVLLITRAHENGSFLAPNFYLNIFIGTDCPKSNKLIEEENVENQTSLQIKMFKVGQK